MSDTFFSPAFAISSRMAVGVMSGEPTICSRETCLLTSLCPLTPMAM